MEKGCEAARREAAKRRGERAVVLHAAEDLRAAVVRRLTRWHGDAEDSLSVVILRVVYPR